MQALVNEGRIKSNLNSELESLCNQIASKDFCFLPVNQVMNFLQKEAAQTINDIHLDEKTLMQQGDRHE
ncbi:hypothetical protein [uncultured Deefgea sp.]|uniref:hypothetical protein n=1 Tax=uncultured Deefgea sp. TaxID=1304914 RepID=UPI00261A4DAC|nr:hypothetical protein [uncultured Deefgea sp.]